MANLDHWPSLRRGGLLAVAGALALASACGGSAVVDTSGGKAGAASVGGATSLAGASAAAGAGSSANAACTAAREPGPCEAAIPSFWHDPKTGLCEPFIYGGCAGNENRYPSREACQQACPNVRDDWDECAKDSDCTSVSTSCCGECEPVAIEGLVAINFAHQTQYRDTNCPVAPPCVPCMPVRENERSEKYFKPACRNAHCTLIDIRETPLTACEKTSDCVLRDGASCCSECDGSDWVAVNKNADFCGGEMVACRHCITPLPQEWAAVCLSGRCRQEGVP